MESGSGFCGGDFMIGNRYYDTTGIIESGMEKLRESIPENERCKTCDGQGKVYVGCALVCSIYEDCFRCNGDGHEPKKLASKGKRNKAG